MKKLSLVLAAMIAASSISFMERRHLPKKPVLIMMAALTLLLEILREAQAQTPRREIRLLG
ncbi:MAG: hypothetical protein V8T08_05895 [Monoglobus pectinilyticus]|uniref:hypothetical protein n=1 Tax=Monoglobus pectinilyticus TaxID=1981510 RepID=UPI00300EC3A2